MTETATQADDFFSDLLADTVRSISEMQRLKSILLKNPLFFEDQNDAEESLLLIDEIIWEEINAADWYRKTRKHQPD